MMPINVDPPVEPGGGVVHADLFAAPAHTIEPTTLVHGAAGGADKFVDNNGTVPGPDVDNQTLYCVVMPRGVNASNASFVGEHTYYTRSGQRIHFAWITNS